MGGEDMSGACSESLESVRHVRRVLFDLHVAEYISPLQVPRYLFGERHAVRRDRGPIGQKPRAFEDIPPPWCARQRVSFVFVQEPCDACESVEKAGDRAHAFDAVRNTRELGIAKPFPILYVVEGLVGEFDQGEWGYREEGHREYAGSKIASQHRRLFRIGYGLFAERDSDPESLNRQIGHWFAGVIRMRW